MDFTLLDNFYSKDICEINIAYSLIVSKPEFRGGDSDRVLILVLDEFSQNPNLFSNNEVKLISTLIKIREANGYIEFKRIYPILKFLILTSIEDTRDEDITKIEALIGNTSQNGNFINNSNYIDFSEIQSEIPMMKNIIMGSFSSPICGEERVSEFQEILIQYPSDYKTDIQSYND